MVRRVDSNIFSRPPHIPFPFTRFLMTIQRRESLFPRKARLVSFIACARGSCVLSFKDFMNFRIQATSPLLFAYIATCLINIFCESQSSLDFFCDNGASDAAFDIHDNNNYTRFHYSLLLVSSFTRVSLVEADVFQFIIIASSIPTWPVKVHEGQLGNGHLVVLLTAYIAWHARWRALTSNSTKNRTGACHVLCRRSRGSPHFPDLSRELDGMLSSTATNTSNSQLCTPMGGPGLKIVIYEDYPPPALCS